MQVMISLIQALWLNYGQFHFQKNRMQEAPTNFIRSLLQINEDGHLPTSPFLLPYSVQQLLSDSNIITSYSSRDETTLCRGYELRQQRSKSILRNSFEKNIT